MIAEIIVDISHEKLDRAFEYIVPEELEDKIKRGSPVLIPFGVSNKKIKGYVIELKADSTLEPERLKKIDSIVEKGTDVEGDLIQLAWFIKSNYGTTMNKALKTVLPVKQHSKPLTDKFICLNREGDELSDYIERLKQRKNSAARLRLMSELSSEKVLPLNIVRDKLNISPAIIKALEKEGFIRTDIKENLRNVLKIDDSQAYDIRLNDGQRKISEDIKTRFAEGDLRPSLIHGITGSGKTEIYIDLIDFFIKQGRQAVVLIPEIALTYQTVLRFYRKFGNRISVINSKLSQAERHDQIMKAKKGEVDIIIGPRSALFSPFDNLGIIIIDEEHEGTYKNENAPRYHTREVAIERARLSGGIVVMGSATPSAETYFRAQKGDFQLYSLTERAKGAELPEVEVVDLRDELAQGNRSIISNRLFELIQDRLSKGEQIILFLNRRGYSNFVSCRSCGEAIKCPHCDVSLKYHRNGKLLCHYCGYEVPMMKNCPKCGSKYIGTFGAGTQKIEEEICRLFPEARVLRMDADTTKEKEGHEKILAAFSNHEADILVGTQMIVKGHDFAMVTLVGILAADLSLYTGDYLASERTFQLITQAAGRAGRSERKGAVVIQTYSPDNYAVKYGAEQNYKEFYEYEMSYRKLLGYPPVMNMLGILFTASSEKLLNTYTKSISDYMDKHLDGMFKIGPATASVSRINDRYRKIIYLKSEDYDKLTNMKDRVEYLAKTYPNKDIQITFDFSMMGK